MYSMYSTRYVSMGPTLCRVGAVVSTLYARGQEGQLFVAPINTNNGDSVGGLVVGMITRYTAR